jgi:cobalt/nickel transport system permease protein
LGGHHSIWFDPYSRIDSPVRRLPAGVKLAAAVAIVLTVVLVPIHGQKALLIFSSVLLLLIAITGLSLVSPVTIVKRVLFLEPVILGAALLALFQPGGVKVFLLLVVRSTLCLWTMTLFAGTTPFDDLLEVMRRLRLPAMLVTTVAMMYRYLSLLTDQTQRMRRARASRTFNTGTLSTWRNLTTIIGHLFIRTADRSERVYAAMCARGWK